MFVEIISLITLSYLVNRCIKEIVKEDCKDGNCGFLDDVNPILEDEEEDQ